MTDSGLHRAPAALWGPLIAAFRRVASEVGRSQLPAPLRPLASFQPAKLLADRPRRAIADALLTDGHLRDLVGARLPKDLWSAADSATAADLVAGYGIEPAFAALVARGRWDDVAALSHQAAAADAERVAADRARRERIGGRHDASDSAKRKIAEADRRTADHRRRADAAEQRARSLEAELGAAREQAERLREEMADLTSRLEEEKRRSRDRLARMRRRAEDAELRARVDVDRAGEIAGQLEQMAARLRQALEANPTSGPSVGAEEPADGAAPAAAIPRRVVAAQGGRPCALPSGVRSDDPLAVEALLQVPDLEVVIDGYNVSKDLRGVPAAALPDQRAWLDRLAAAVAARNSVHVTVVWDGDDVRTTASRRRSVKTIYTQEGETADDRIVALVSELDQPVLVVTSDREVRERCEDAGANVVASGLFLRAAG